MQKLTSAIFQKKLLAWFDCYGRKNLPWQINKTPYRVWISEIMLQQTQVTTVIPYFERFMARFPDIQTLAKANQDDVLAFWSGLGYYHRARNLHKAALQIIRYHQGVFPKNLQDIEELPGIGKTTAGAIVALAYGVKAPILDGNVKRVLTRIHGIKKWPGLNEVNQKLWVLAEKFTPTKRVSDYTQAIMDLGAEVCIRKPRCESCPLSKFCLAHQLGIEKDIPTTAIKKIRPVKKITFLIVKNDEHILLEKRAENGFWAGLYCFPILTDFVTFEDIQLYCKNTYGFNIKSIKKSEPFRHTFTHFHMDILPIIIHIDQRSVNQHKKYIWYISKSNLKVGIPAPVASLMKNL